MSKSNEKVAKIASVDPVWDQMRKEAEAATAADTSLGGFLFTSVLNPGSFEEALCHRLAQRLGNADIGAELIVQGFEDALSGDPDIGNAARADILAVLDRDPACDRHVEPFLYFKGYQALQTYRMAHQLFKMGRKDFAYYLQSRSSMIFGTDIHPTAKVGRGIMIDHAHAIVIGATSVVEDNVSMLHSVTLGGTGKAGGDRHPKVRRGCLIGAGASILGNIEIGECSRIAAGSVVLHPVPANRTVAGVPAKVVGYAGCDEPARRMEHRLVDTSKQAKDA